MIEINLIPDVKQQFIQAQRYRNIVITVSIFTAIVAAGVVVLLALYVFGIQAARASAVDGGIKKQFDTLKGVPDLDKALTLQNQLSKISTIHEGVTMSSRVFDVLTTIVPTDDSQISIKSTALDSDNKTITITGETPKGYQALDIFKKTILATKFQYTTADDNNPQLVALTDMVTDGERAYSESDDGQKILTFTISFVYTDALLARNSLNGKIIGPSVTNATDSALEVPASLFSSSAAGKQ